MALANELEELAVEIAREAGELARRRRAEGVAIAATKSSIADIVTELQLTEAIVSNATCGPPASAAPPSGTPIGKRSRPPACASKVSAETATVRLGEPATGPQESYLSTLAQQAGEHVDTEGLSKADASLKIEELKEQTGR